MCPTYSVNCHIQSDHCFMIASPPLSLELKLCNCWVVSVFGGFFGNRQIWFRFRQCLFWCFQLLVPKERGCLGARMTHASFSLERLKNLTGLQRYSIYLISITYWSIWKDLLHLFTFCTLIGVQVNEEVFCHFLIDVEMFGWLVSLNFRWGSWWDFVIRNTCWITFPLT